MTIAISCECGQEILAEDQFGGRRVRCASCQRVLMLPASEAKNRVVTQQPVPTEQPRFDAPSQTAAAPVTETVTAEKPAPKPVDTSWIHFNCACGATFQARREHAGEPTKCPRCGDILFIPTRG